MSSDPPGASAGSFFERLKRHRVVLAIAGVVSAAALVVGLAADALDVWSAVAPSGAPSAGQAAPTAGGGAAPSSTLHTSPPSASTQPSTAGCRTTRGGQSVDCLSPHRYEAISLPCTAEHLVDLMGGDPKLDVLFDRPRPDGSAGCGVSLDEEEDRSIREVLDIDAAQDDHWRRCVDMSGSRFTRCDLDHGGEYVGTGKARRAEQEDCDKAVSDYMRVPIDVHADTLRVRAVAVVTENDPARCLVSVRGTQPLTSSLRWLDTQAVPVRR